MNTNPIPELATQLKQLRLSGILDSLESRNRQAIQGKLAYTEFLAMLVSDEVARRENKKFSMRLRRAQFRTTKTLEQFEFERLPRLNRALIHDHRVRHPDRARDHVARDLLELLRRQLHVQPEVLVDERMLGRERFERARAVAADPSVADPAERRLPRGEDRAHHRGARSTPGPVALRSTMEVTVRALHDARGEIEQRARLGLERGDVSHRLRYALREELFDVLA